VPCDEGRLLRGLASVTCPFISLSCARTAIAVPNMGTWEATSRTELMTASPNSDACDITSATAGNCVASSLRSAAISAFASLSAFASSSSSLIDFMALPANVGGNRDATTK